MKGSDSIVAEELYQGTSKSAEGYLAAILFEKAKDEGCQIQVNWQDQDSSSEKSFRSVYGAETSARVMKCGGHIGRSHATSSKISRQRKSLTLVTFPSM